LNGWLFVISVTDFLEAFPGNFYALFSRFRNLWQNGESLKFCGGMKTEEPKEDFSGTREPTTT